MNHRFVGYDEGRQRLGLFDTARPGEVWSISLAELPLARDLQRLEGGRVLVGFDRGYFEVDLANGAVVKVVDRWKGVTTVRRVGGRTLISGVDLDGGGGITLLTLSPEDEVEQVVRRPGSYVRLMRPTPGNTLLWGADDHFLETDEHLREVRRLVAPGFRHCWMAHSFSDGRTLASGGYGPFMARFDNTGALTSTFGGYGEVPAEVSPNFYASFELLPHGGVLVANWQGHGPDNGKKGRQLIEFDAQGVYRDSWSDPERISSLQGILVL